MPEDKTGDDTRGHGVICANRRKEKGSLWRQGRSRQALRRCLRPGPPPCRPCRWALPVPVPAARAVFAYRAVALSRLLQPSARRIAARPCRRPRSGATWLAPACAGAGEGLSGWLDPSRAHGSGCLRPPLATLPNLAASGRRRASPRWFSTYACCCY